VCQDRSARSNSLRRHEHVLSGMLVNANSGPDVRYEFNAWAKLSVI